MSPQAELDAAGNPTADHTVTSPREGQLVYLHGYEPAIVFGVEPDGKVEVGRFATFEFTEQANLSTARGPRPDSAGPEPESPADRVAALEEQLAALTKLLSSPGVVAAIQQATTPAASPAAAPVEAPSEPSAAPAAPSSPEPVLLFGNASSGSPTPPATPAAPTAPDVPGGHA